jgi:hypothetical protein
MLYSTELGYSTLALALPQVINSMKSFAHTVAPVAWLVTLPQLISRVSHTNADVTSVINVSTWQAMHGVT